MIKHISKEDSQKENMCSREAVCLPGPVWPQAWALILSLCTLLTSQILGSTVMLASPYTIACLHLNKPDSEMKSVVPPFLPVIGHSMGPCLRQLSGNRFSPQTTCLGNCSLLSPGKVQTNKKGEMWAVESESWVWIYFCHLPAGKWCYLSQPQFPYLYMCVNIDRGVWVCVCDGIMGRIQWHN